MDRRQRELARDQIIAAREAMGWSATKLAQEAGISQTTMTKVDRAESVHPGTIAKLRKALGMEPLAAVQARTGYPTDIELVRDVVGLWLLGMPEGRRAEAASRLIRAMNDGAKDHNADTQTA